MIAILFSFSDTYSTKQFSIYLHCQYVYPSTLSFTNILKSLWHRNNQFLTKFWLNYLPNFLEYIPKLLLISRALHVGLDVCAEREQRAALVLSDANSTYISHTRDTHTIHI